MSAADNTNPTSSTSQDRPTRGVPIIINGQEYRLRYRMRDLKDLKEQTGKGVMNGEILRTLDDQDGLVTVVSYGLRDQLTYDEIMDGMDLEEARPAMKAVLLSWAKAFPEIRKHIRRIELMERQESDDAEAVTEEPIPDPISPDQVQ